MSRNSAMWKFADTFDPARRKTLEGSDDLGAIAPQLLREADEIAFSLERGEADGLTHCRRPVFHFRVRSETFDAFYNGPRGYRAQYLFSAEIGQAENNLMLRILSEKLVAAARELDGDPSVAAFDLEKSLAACSAKIWIDERGFPLKETPRDLAIPRWVGGAALGIDKAIWGLHAPQGNNLVVKGAFLDAAGNEVVPTDKVRRRFEIHLYGFS